MRDLLAQLEESAKSLSDRLTHHYHSGPEDDDRSDWLLNLAYALRKLERFESKPDKLAKILPRFQGAAHWLKRDKFAKQLARLKKEDPALARDTVREVQRWEAMK